MTELVVADNWGGLFDEIPSDQPVSAPDTASSDSAPDTISSDSDALPFVPALDAAFVPAPQFHEIAPVVEKTQVATREAESSGLIVALPLIQVGLDLTPPHPSTPMLGFQIHHRPLVATGVVLAAHCARGVPEARKAESPGEIRAASHPGGGRSIPELVLRLYVCAQHTTSARRRRPLLRLVWRPAWRSPSCSRRPLRRLLWRPPWRLASCGRRPRRCGHRIRSCALRPDPEASVALRPGRLTERFDRNCFLRSGTLQRVEISSIDLAAPLRVSFLEFTRPRVPASSMEVENRLCTMRAAAAEAKKKMFLPPSSLALRPVAAALPVPVRCGWFSSVNLVDHRSFRCLGHNVFLLNDGRPRLRGKTIALKYANSFLYELSIRVTTCVDPTMTTTARSALFPKSLSAKCSMQCSNQFSATASASVSSSIGTSAHCMTGFTLAINKSCSPEGIQIRRCSTSGQLTAGCSLDADISDDIVIVDCGELPGGANDGVVNFFMDGDMYPDWLIDLDEKPAETSWWMDAVESAQVLGNETSKKQDYKTALRKYRNSMCSVRIQLGEGSAGQVTRNMLANEAVRSFYEGWSVGLPRQATYMPYQTVFEGMSAQITVLLEPLVSIEMSRHVCICGNGPRQC